MNPRTRRVFCSLLICGNMGILADYAGYDLLHWSYWTAVLPTFAALLIMRRDAKSLEETIPVQWGALRSLARQLRALEAQKGGE